MNNPYNNISNVEKVKPHYSPYIKHNNIIYISGQLPISEETSEPISKNIKEQTEFVLEKLMVILREIGSNRNRVLKVTIYISDIKNWDIVNSIYAKFFKNHRPARTIIPTKKLHYGCSIEIDAIAYIE